ncbi:MAG TPA: hypothetical protein VFR24_18235 [Candidatus Angelobacter sp.]|jgi:hypothetical protein|nr:hypothetical protein [Candidatus Angelobacter sp.]
MWTVLVLFVLWILSMYFYMPLPVVVALFAALASGMAVTVWFALSNRNRRLGRVGEQDTKL